MHIQLEYLISVDHAPIFSMDRLEKNLDKDDVIDPLFDDIIARVHKSCSEHLNQLKADRPSKSCPQSRPRIIKKKVPVAQ